MVCSLSIIIILTSYTSFPTKEIFEAGLNLTPGSALLVHATLDPSRQLSSNPIRCKSSVDHEYRGIVISVSYCPSNTLIYRSHACILVKVPTHTLCLNLGFCFIHTLIFALLVSKSFNM